MRINLEKKYVDRAKELIAGLRKHNVREQELIEQFIPKTQKLVVWLTNNSMDTLRDYLYTEFGRDILVYFQKNHNGEIGALYKELPELPVACKDCGEYPIIDESTQCLTSDCAFQGKIFEDVAEWNARMTKFKGE